jgi:preprotein translocase subunit Sec63
LYPKNGVAECLRPTREIEIEKLDKDSAQPKVIKSSMFNKMQDFLDDFGARNIFEDELLVELSQQARDLIEGVSPAGIKKNDVMRKRIKNEMNELKSAIDVAIEDMPRRKIRMAG